MSSKAVGPSLAGPKQRVNERSLDMTAVRWLAEAAERIKKCLNTELTSSKCVAQLQPSYSLRELGWRAFEPSGHTY